MLHDLKQKTARAFAWSFLQSWSVKFLSLLLFFVLARYLTPREMGLAQSVIVLLALVAVTSEQGFHSAVVQRPELQAADVNLPFVASTGLALLFSVLMLLYAQTLAVLLKEPQAVDLIRVAAIIPPITAANGMLVAMLRRELDFRTLARASIAASLVSGGVSLLLVINGWGALGLVIQAVVSGLVTALFVWRHTRWRPRADFRLTSFRTMLGFSSATFASQLIDFSSGRLVDLMVLSRFGLAALGLYAVGAKLYLTLLELMAGALVMVAMSAMAKLLQDRVRLKRTYLRFLFLVACTALPLFVGVAALAPELCGILFGSQWLEAAPIARWLCLLGAVQVMQFFNGAALDATGHPRSGLLINIVKLTLGAAVLMFYPADSVVHLTLVFVLAQLCVAPLSFALAQRCTGARGLEVLRQVGPGLLAATLGYLAVTEARLLTGQQGFGVWLTTFGLGLCFALVFAASLLAACRQRLQVELQDAWNSYRR